MLFLKIINKIFVKISRAYIKVIEMLTINFIYGKNNIYSYLKLRYESESNVGISIMMLLLVNIENKSI
jgi:hypothetical protein